MAHSQLILNQINLLGSSLCLYFVYSFSAQDWTQWFEFSLFLNQAISVHCWYHQGHVNQHIKWLSRLINGMTDQPLINLGTNNMNRYGPRPEPWTIHHSRNHKKSWNNDPPIYTAWIDLVKIWSCAIDPDFVILNKKIHENSCLRVNEVLQQNLVIDQQSNALLEINKGYLHL